jgi:NAD(P)H-hydrate epimerase
VNNNIFKKLYLPPKKSHKGDNGIITIIAGSKQYHGSAVLAIKAASYFVDLIYFYSVQENQRLLHELKAGVSEFIAIHHDLQSKILKSDAVLIGPGMEVNQKNRIFINNLLKHNKNKKFILDAGAIRMADKKLLSENIILTPHKDEYKALFGKSDILAMAKKYGCIILLKGETDVICNSRKKYYNKGGNAGLTKGGTGDVLAGLITALAAKNECFLAAFSGAFFNKKAGDSLYKKKGYYYNATDLTEELPKIAYYFLKFRIK